jgi:hypothetical protein
MVIPGVKETKVVEDSIAPFVNRKLRHLLPHQTVNFNLGLKPGE